MTRHARNALPFLLTITLFALTLPLESRAGSLETIQSKITRFLKRPGVRSADWGIQVLDPATGEVLVEVNPDKTFLPASVLKLLTTSAALEKLGPDFRFRTGIYTNGFIEPGGTLSGDLILVGRGDPHLTDDEGTASGGSALADLAEKIRQAGIREIQGDLIGDESYFDVSYNDRIRTTGALRSSNGAPINAFCVHNNILRVHVNPSERKRPVRIAVEPRTSYFSIRNQATTGGPKSRRTIHARLVRAQRQILVSGVLPLTQTFSQHIVLENPSEVAAAMFREELGRLGISVRGGIRIYRSGDVPQQQREQWRLLAEHQSQPLIRSLQTINKESQNLHAEMLLRTLGAELKGRGRDDAGLEAVQDFLVEAGIFSDRVHLRDGCGLSRENLITPRFQTSLLEFLSKRPYFDLYLNTLAVSGIDGTLKHRLAAAQTRGYVYAKTGTLHGVTALSGYITTRSGRNLVFSIFANRVRAEERVKKTIDEICSFFVNQY